MIIWATPMVEVTIIGEKELGIRCLTMICSLLQLIDRAASMYSFSRTLSICARSSRALEGMLLMARARMVLK